MNTLTERDESYTALKRRFILTLCAFVLVVVVATYQLLSDDTTESSVGANKESPPPGEAALSPIEIAFFKGKALGLSEDPRALPPLSESRLKTKAKHWCFGGSDVKITSKSASDEVVRAFVEGYAAGYPEYFDATAAEEAGFRYGLKYDPMLHAFPEGWLILARLDHEKKFFLEKYNLDEATWILFRSGFSRGFARGWPEVADGITAKAGEVIRLVE